MRRPGILWVKSSVPWPLTQGNHFIAYNLIRHLHEEFAITLVVPVKDRDEERRSEALAPFARVVPVPRPSTRSLFHRALYRVAYHATSAVRHRPPEIFYENFGALRRTLRAEAASGAHDMAFLHYWFLHPLIREVKPLPAAVLLHDCEPQRIESEMATHPERAPRLKRNLRAAVAGHHALTAEAARVLFYSQEDLDDWSGRAGGPPANARVFPYMFAFADARERAEEEDRILFTGHMSYGPNVDAVIWFVREILPAIRARRPGAVFRIAGKRPAPEVLDLAGEPGVEVTGYVDDMTEELCRAAVYAAPIRFGGGLKIKLLEAAAQACPVVATGCALRGFGVGDEVEAADDPAGFASAVAALLADGGRRRRLGRRFREAMVARFGPDAAGSKVAALLGDVISSAAGPPQTGA